MSHGLLGQAFVYLAAAVVAVSLAKRLGLGSVLGYLLAGVAIGPFALKLVGQDSGDVLHFAEFGVVMMLFLVGLELRPSLFWQLRRPILGLGTAQVVATAAALGGVGLLLGLSWKPAVAIGLTLAMSSTAIALQSLAEKGLLKTEGGQASFAVLLFQDVAVIPILAVFPLLAAVAPTSDEAGRPAWMQVLLVLGAVVGIILGGRYLVRPAFRVLARVRLREAFTAAALFLVVGIALLMQAVGVSPALGTFLAGVVLAESEYRHELEADIEPFKGLLLGLFFISVGAQIDLGFIATRPLFVGALVLALMAAKLAVLYGLGRTFSLGAQGRWVFAFSLAQVGEFAFVLIGYATQSRIYGPELAAPLLAAVALSMVLTPLAFLVLERLVLPRLGRAEARAQDAIAHGDNPVVIAGFGRVGQVVGRLLRASGIGATVLDLDPSMVDLLRRLGMSVHYGDASRLDLLQAAGCAKAKLFVLAVDDPEQSVQIAATVRRNFPGLRILARARNRTHHYELRDAGVEQVFRETLGSALEMGAASLRELGHRAHAATRLARLWREHDEKALEDLGKLRGEAESTYFAAARKALEDAEAMMRKETSGTLREEDAAWDNETLRAEVSARAAQGQPP